MTGGTALLRIIADKHLVRDTPLQGLKPNSLSVLYGPTKSRALIQSIQPVTTGPFEKVNLDKTHEGVWNSDRFGIQLPHAHPERTPLPVRKFH